LTPQLQAKDMQRVKTRRWRRRRRRLLLLLLLLGEGNDRATIGAQHPTQFLPSHSRLVAEKTRSGVEPGIASGCHPIEDKNEDQNEDQQRSGRFNGRRWPRPTLGASTHLWLGRLR
jgi:hypothetical protein